MQHEIIARFISDEGVAPLRGHVDRTIEDRLQPHPLNVSEGPSRGHAFDCGIVRCASCTGTIENSAVRRSNYLHENTADQLILGLLRELPVEPCSRERPVALDRRGRDVQGRSGVLDAESTEEAAFHHVAEAAIETLETAKSLVESG